MDKPSITLPNPQEAVAPFVQRLDTGEHTAAQLLEEAYERGVEDFRAALLKHLEEDREAIKQSIYDKVLFGSKESEETQGVSTLIARIGTLVIVILALAFLINGFVDFLASRL